MLWFATVCCVLCVTRDNFLVLQLRFSFFQVEDDYGILSEQLVNSATTTAHLNFSREILSSWFNYLLKQQQKKAAISKINSGENPITLAKKNSTTLFLVFFETRKIFVLWAKISNINVTLIRFANPDIFPEKKKSSRISWEFCLHFLVFYILKILLVVVFWDSLLWLKKLNHGEKN